MSKLGWFLVGMAVGAAWALWGAFVLGPVVTH